MRFLLLSYFLFCFLVGHAQSIVYVTEVGRGDGSGTSWANALPGTLLASRLPAAAAGTQFWIAAGTYKPTTTLDRSASFSIASGVSLYGGFSGYETSLDQRTRAAETRLSGDIGIVGDALDNCTHVVSLINTSQTVVINGLTITNGRRLSGYDYSSLGAGLYVEPSVNNLRLTLTSCRFVDNVVEGSLAGGGAIAIINWSGGLCFVDIDGCFFSGNEGETGGAIALLNRVGGIYTDIKDCVFTANKGVFGGAIEAEDSGVSSAELTIQRCQFMGNTASGHGGALSIHCNTLLYNSLSQDNIAAGSRGGGGAIDASRCPFAYYQNCLFSGNTAYRGGAIYSSSFELERRHTFVNCTFANNQASISGGAVFNDPFAGNSPGGSLPNYSSIRLTSCIVWGNTAPTFPGFYAVYGSEFSTRPLTNYCIIQDFSDERYVGANNSAQDPAFANVLGNNYRLSANSPAINAGAATSPTYLTATDLDGNPRLRGGRVDMGAYEFPCDGNGCPPFTIRRRL